MMYNSKHLALAAGILALGSLAVAQTVTVPTDFATIQLAADSFRSGGTNAGNVAANVIQVDASATLSGGAGIADEELILRDDVTPYEDLTIIGINGRPQLRVQNTNATAPATADSLEIETDADITFENLLICQSLTNAGGAPRDVVRGIGQETAGPSASATTHTFNDCIFTGIAASGAPLVTDLASAYTNQVGNYGGTITGDLVTAGSLADQVVNYAFNDCIVSHCRQSGSGRDGLVENGGDHTASYPVGVGPSTFSIDGCDFTYNGTRHFITLGFGVPGNPGSSIITVNDTRMYGTSFHAFQQSFGPDNGRMDMTNTRIAGQPDASGSGRCFSGDQDVILRNMDGNLWVSGNQNVCIVQGSTASEHAGETGTWTNSTFIGGTQIIFGLGDGVAADYLIDANNCIFARRDNAGTPTGDAFGGTGYVIDVTDSSVVTAGNNGFATVEAAPGTLTQGTPARTADPNFWNAVNEPAGDASNLLAGSPSPTAFDDENYWAVQNDTDYSALTSGGSLFLPNASVSNWESFEN